MLTDRFALEFGVELFVSAANDGYDDGWRSNVLAAISMSRLFSGARLGSKRFLKSSPSVNTKPANAISPY